MNFRQYFFCLFILLYAICVNAQQKLNDTIFLHNKIFEFYNSNPDSLIFYSTRLEKASVTKYGKACSFIGRAKAYYQKRDLLTSEKFATFVVDFIGSHPKSNYELINLNDAYRRLFYIKKNQGKYDEAIHWLEQREQVLMSFEDQKIYLRNFLDIKKCKASVKIKLELFDEALEILNSVSKKAEVLDLKESNEKVTQFFKQERANILNLLGNVYTYKHENYPKKHYMDSAKACYRKAYAISKDLKYVSSIDTEAYYALRMIDVLLKKREYSSVLKYIKQNDSIFKKASKACQLGLYNKKSIAYLKLNKHDSSIVYSKKYMSKLPNNNTSSVSNLVTIYDNLAKAYMFNKENDSALKYSNLTLKKYKEIEQNKKATVKDLYEIELTDAKKLNDILIKTKQTNYWKILVIVCLVLLSLGYVIFNSIKKKQKVIVLKEEKLETKEDKSSKSDFKIDSNIVAEILKGLSEFEKTTMYLDENFNSNVLADYLNTNTTYLSQVVNQHKEKTFKHYITDLRLQYVIEKLHSDKKFQKYSIESIGKEIGYSNASAFTRAFKKKMGVTPSQYIKDKVKNN